MLTNYHSANQTAQDLSLRVSLIVCTRNRCDKLAICLEYIGRMEPPFEWELIIIDNGSTDKTPEVVADFLRTFPHPHQVLNVLQAGNGGGRNAGIAVSRGEIVAFTDDDCYVDQTFLAEISRVFEDQKLGYLSGRILLFDPTDYPATINLSQEKVVIPGGGPIKSGLIQGANMAFRRRALEEAGGFNPRFGAGTPFAGEDWELAMRIGAAGWSGGYFPQPVVQHHHGRKGKDAPRLFRFYCLGEGAVYARGLVDPARRRNVLRLWSRSILKDLQTLSLKHVAFVGEGAIRYWVVTLLSKNETRSGQDGLAGKTEPRLPGQTERAI